MSIKGEKGAGRCGLPPPAGNRTASTREGGLNALEETAWLLLAAALPAGMAPALGQGMAPGLAKYVFLFIGDGMSNPQATAAQYYNGTR